MKKFFHIDNPVWRFIGNLADMFLLSVFWYLCCLPVVTLGAGTTALYYVTLRMTSDQEGYTAASFRKSFRQNVKQATLVWLIFLACALILAIDIYWSLLSTSLFAKAMFFTFAVVAVIYCLCLAFIFPFMARCENTIKKLLGMCFVISLRNFLPVLSTVLVTLGIFASGLFLFWPLLLIAPGLAAYLNSYIFNRILARYDMVLPDM